jgi:hypothetical protein
MSQTQLQGSGPTGKRDLERLMLYHDRQFVDLAYQLFLGRPADEAGLAHHLENLRAGESRREIAFRIGDSEEARIKGVDEDLFKRYKTWRRIENMPYIGAILLVILSLVRIRYVVKEFRRIQNAAYTR